MYQNTNVSSWGAPVPERASPQQWSGNQSQSETQDDSSDDYYDDEDSEDDEEYAPLQMGAWGAQPTGPDADANAIQMPDWNARPTEGTPSLTFTSADWGKLCDPNVVVKAGLGSGNLHRKGANYKPVDERLILNQRLKLGGPVPSSGKKKKRGKKKGPPPPPAAHRPVGKPVSSSLRPPLAQSAWGSSQLASTPFWESGGAKASKHAPANLRPPPPQQLQSPAKPAAAASTRLPSGRPTPQGGSKWHTQHLQENPVAPPHTPASNWNNQPLQENKAPPVSKWVSQPLQENPTPPTPPQYQPSTAFPSKAKGSAASKYAPQPTEQPAVQQPIQAPAPTEHTPSNAIHGTISLTGPSPVTPSRKTIFQLNIELIPGVSAILPVYETDDYSVLVKEFGAKHHLTISPEAEFTFAEKIKQMVAALHKQQEERDQQGF